MILFKLITTCPNPHRHEAEVSHLSPGSIPDTANLLCQSFTFSPDHTPSQLLPIFPLGSCSSDPHRPLGFSASYRRYRCPRWLQHSGNAKAPGDNTGHSKPILLFMEGSVCCCWRRMILAKWCMTHHDHKRLFSGAPPAPPISLCCQLIHQQ